ncbi:Finger of DNA polymerase lambda domain containing protein [Ceratobasidium theobromae]|uniref:DNA polymerase n=1 Tax=Ceratobasidium theobromae TaxID=1582974 RepID=A0A5N5QKE6_9AGAM|nr:Finger of DNA polymerase lambda domain containing protein [Ceratobasidium theobromae]
MPKAHSRSPSTSPCPTPPAESQVLNGITIYVISAKLDPKEVGEMFSLAQNSGAKLSRIPQNASVLITTLTMKRRLERHISWDVANTKYIVSPLWLRACAEQNKFLPFSQFQTIKTAASERRTSAAQAKAPAAQSATSPAETAEPSNPSTTTDLGDYTHVLSTHRCSPLICPNQGLCVELAILMKARFLEGESNSELSYSRAIAISEYLKTGHIKEAQKIAASERFKTLSQLTLTHGIGPAKAREHYEAGHKTIEDLKMFYASKSKGGTYAGVLAALRLQCELISTIPRKEVQSIAKKVFDELTIIQPGCDYTICGGYRRGKPFSNDIDIIFTHKQPGLERHLCTKFVEHLRSRGIVIHTLHESAYTSNHEDTHGRLKSGRTSMDVLDKALVILKFPNSVHRRVDLIFAPYNVYWTAVVGWTGSKQFERDLRIHAKQQTRLRDSKPVVAYSEEEVFSVLGLKYVAPELRNADI